MRSFAYQELKAQLIFEGKRGTSSDEVFTDSVIKQVQKGFFLENDKERKILRDEAAAVDPEVVRFQTDALVQGLELEIVDMDT
ncbi:hypothetical protein N0V83_001252 [Neocucurbitaria cava]|uniref:Uncharacterized protein n=1 Tax=Neocucurbitaria cava TaxID=798079 RepID=A0A9W8YFU5_9PLEO|nr:hypothetical protein N0V83_001252 [Neocucurbitaria cava]